MSAMNHDQRQLIAGADFSRQLDVVFVNAPLRDYAIRPRVNDFTLPALGMAYIATYAAHQGFNVGVLDAEAHGLTTDEVQAILTSVAPRWVGFNLLAPTYNLSATIAAGLPASIRIMAGGHQAKALPTEILADPRFVNLDALILGEAELRVATLLGDTATRAQLPQVMWRDKSLGTINTGHGDRSLLAPAIDDLPVLDRRYLADDPYCDKLGRIEANMVGSRGCPYNCSFCGAAVSANPDVSIRTRKPLGLLEEMDLLHDRYGVTAFRYVDDLFLGYERFINACMQAFTEHRVGDRYAWDATGRINILYRAPDSLLDTLKANGCREIALGVESGSARLLDYMGKRIAPEMTRQVVRRLTERGINVKGYFILGFPTETPDELHATVRHVHDLWEVSDSNPGRFRASVFEFRPYPGTPEWNRLLATGHYQAEQLLRYDDIDLTDEGLDEAMRGRDEFNFSVNIQFGEADLRLVRSQLVALSREQHERSAAYA
ncbi:MAG TPA: radical SAM protein [Jatrophihabitans sp.]|nr:radical SAM protein [Jatrophihabitans sp.]